MTEEERRAETEKQLAMYANSMQKAFAVPIVCIGVRTDGIAAIALNERVPMPKLIEYLKQLTAMLEKKTT